MRLEYEVNRNDAATFAKSLISLQNKLSQHVFIVILVSTLIALVTHIALTATQSLWAQLVHPLPALPMLYLLDVTLFISTAAISTLCIINQIKKHYSHLIGRKQHNITLCYDDKGLEYQHDNDHRQHPWSNLSALVKSHTAVYLSTTNFISANDTNQNSLIIPKQIFTSTQEFNRFIELVQNKAAKTITIS